MVGLTGHRGISVYLWFLVIVGLMHTSLCMGKTSKACSTLTSCKRLKLTCDDHQRIRLLNQLYKYSNKSTHCKCSSSSSCVASNPDNCIVIENTKCQKSVSRLHAYLLYSRCSGMESMCQIQVQGGGLKMCAKLMSDSNIVTYDCVNEKHIVHFCDEVSLRGTSVHVIFNGTETNKAYTNHTCSCTITGDTNVPWTIHSEDIRYNRDGNRSKCASVRLNGVKPHCGNKAQKNFIYKEQWDTANNTITLEDFFKESEDDKPTMVWIRVDGQGNPVTVQCNGAAAPPPVGGQGSGSSVGDKGAVAPPLVGGLGSGSSVGDKGGMVAAVVVPILLIVSGIVIALGILYWRKRRKQNEKQTTGNANGIQAHNNAYTCTRADAYTRNTASTSKHTDNYIDFSADQNGDDYATIESIAISPYSLARDVADIDTGYATPVDAVGTGYNKHNLVTKVVVRDTNYSRLPGNLNDDHSHVTGFQGFTQNAAGGNATGYEYAHVNVQGDSQSYSELEKNMPIPKMEDNTYDHVRRAISDNENAQSQNVNDNAVTSPNNPPYPSSEEQEVQNSDATLEDTNATHDYYILSKVADI